MKKIKIYIIARISEEVHPWIDFVCEKLDASFDIFSPKDHNPWSKRHSKFSMKVFEQDLEAIKNSDIGLMLPEYGNDCSWEAGYYANSKKSLVVFIDSQLEWLRDWMVKGGVDYIITCNSNTYEIIRKDPILKYKKNILIKNLQDLNKELYKIYEK